jgi:aminopeptidase N
MLGTDTLQYEKGFNFLYYLEHLVGYEKWDKFIPYVRQSLFKGDETWTHGV